MTGWRQLTWAQAIAVALFSVLLLGAPATADLAAPSFQELEESLTCQCGCGLTVHSCNHLQCPSALPLRDEIRAQMELGRDKAAILSYFADKYGEKILSSPTAAGFNLLAWTAPFILLALGGVAVAITVLRWQRRSHAAASPGAARPPAAARSPYAQTLERELKNFDA